MAAFMTATPTTMSFLLGAEGGKPHLVIPYS